MTVIYTASDDLVKWASNELFGRPDYFADAKALGFTREGKLIAATVYDRFYKSPDGKPISIELSIATIDKRWATRHNLYHIFAYPFIQLALERVQITTSVVNEGVNSLVSRLGFIKEGTHRKAHFDGGDCYSWSMLSNECRWLK